MAGLTNCAHRDIAQLRESYRALNASFPATFAFRFGQGAGFGSETLGLIKTMMGCLHRGIRFALATGGRPAGIAAYQGFHDYFEPIFPTEHLGLLNALNVPTVPGSGRFPFLRHGVSALLRRMSGLDLFMMDDPGDSLPSRLVVPGIGMDLEYPEACALLLRMIWVYRGDVARYVSDTVTAWNLPASYVAVHLRRGDKITESPYAAIDGYVKIIGELQPDGAAVAVASDDGGAIDELRRRLDERFDVITCSDIRRSGYVQRRFNDLPAAERFEATKRFLAELEMLRGGASFIGSGSSNVTFLLAMMRAGRGVHRVT